MKLQIKVLTDCLRDTDADKQAIKNQNESLLENKTEQDKQLIDMQGEIEGLKEKLKTSEGTNAAFAQEVHTLTIKLRKISTSTDETIEGLSEKLANFGPARTTTREDLQTTLEELQDAMTDAMVRPFSTTVLVCAWRAVLLPPASHPTRILISPMRWPLTVVYTIGVC